MAFEAAFHGYTKALEMMLSQFGVPVNIKDQKVSAQLNYFYMFTRTQIINEQQAIFFLEGELGKTCSYNCFVTVCIYIYRYVICYTTDLEARATKLLSGYITNKMKGKTSV